MNFAFMTLPLILASLAAIAIIVFLTYYASLQKKMVHMQQHEIREARRQLTELNEKVQSQKEELQAQRDHLYNQNEAITASISYAERIQAAMLPPLSYIHEFLAEVLVFYRPRDIVSGDFYWIKKVNRSIIVASADCTGHGVPGALMSMLGISYLNEIVQRREITQADQVLNEMRQRIKQALRQHGRPDEPKDGIDMAVCAINEKSRRMQYAGANSPLYLIRDVDGGSELNEIKPDRMPLGYYNSKDKAFTNHEIQLEIGDTFYLFSDGFPDQKGGPEGKKYMSRKFKDLLLRIHERPMFEQEEVLDRELNSWKGEKAQIDDIMILGIRI